jgi:lysylphosphatidylglycerol synthetase-like protein (DUF2156 family)
MWALGSTLLVVWFILKFILHKGGYVHIILIAALSIIVVQLLASRKARYHKSSTGR